MRLLSKETSMTRFRIVNLLVGVPLLGTAVLGGGCVSTTLDLSANHPARPDAAAGAAPDPATVLQPDAALYPASTAAEEAARASEPDGTRQNPYIGQGTIRDVGGGALVVQHEAIPGFMGAMTMAYPVADGVDVGSLAAGDAVTFRIELPESGGYRIFQVEAIEASEPQQEGAHEHAGPDSEQPPGNPQPQR
jgi:Cu/Ag efflux protein CusF